MRLGAYTESHIALAIRVKIRAGPRFLKLRGGMSDSHLVL